MKRILHSFDTTLDELLAPNPDAFVPAFGLPRLQAACSTSTLSATTDVAIGFGEPNNNCYVRANVRPA